MEDSFDVEATALEASGVPLESTFSFNSLTSFVSLREDFFSGFGFFPFPAFFFELLESSPNRAKMSSTEAFSGNFSAGGGFESGMGAGGPSIAAAPSCASAIAANFSLCFLLSTLA